MSLASDHLPQSLSHRQDRGQLANIYHPSARTAWEGRGDPANVNPQKSGPPLLDFNPSRPASTTRLTSGWTAPGARGLLAEALGLLVATAAWMHVLASFPLSTQDLPMLCVDARQISFSLNLIPLSLAAALEATYPPLVYLFTLPFYKTMGLDPAAAFLSVTVQTALLAPATYLLARLMTGPAGAWVAYLLTAASTVALAFSGAYFPDQMTSLLTPLFLASWFASRGFTRPWASALFGILLGLGLLVKLTFVVFTWVALLDAAWQVFRHPDRMKLNSPPVLFFLGSSLAVGLLWTSMSRECYLVDLLVGELTLGLLVVWLSRRLHTETSLSVQKGIRALIAVTLALGLAAPYYAVSLNHVTTLYETYALWKQNAPEVSREVGPLNFQVPLFPGVGWTLPLGLSALFLAPRSVRRTGILLAAQLALGYLGLLAMDLDYEPVMVRYLVHAVPLAAALAGLGACWLRRLAPLAPALLLALLLNQYNPEEWVALRTGKGVLTIGDKPAPYYPESPVVRELVRHLQNRFPDRAEVDLRILCRTTQESQELIPGLGWPTHELAAAMAIPFRHGLGRTIELDRLLPSDGPALFRRPGYLLTATSSPAEELELVRDAEVTLELRLSRLEVASNRDGRLAVWKAIPR